MKLLINRTLWNRYYYCTNSDGEFKKDGVIQDEYMEVHNYITDNSITRYTIKEAYEDFGIDILKFLENHLARCLTLK